MNIILQPCSNKLAQDHFNKTILGSIKIDDIKQYLNDAQLNRINNIYPTGVITLWGVNDNSSDKWERINEGDICLFSYSGGIKVSSVVTYKFKNVKLAEYLWDVDSDGKTWKNIYLVKEIKLFEISYTEFNKSVGYKENFIIQSFNVLNEDKTDMFLSKYPINSNQFFNTNITEQELINIDKQLESLQELNKQVVTTQRKEQSALRSYLFKNKKIDKCAICGNEMPIEFLWCSHIKQRSLCSDAEKKDYKNIVLPMCKFGCDDLYEKGYIGVKDGKVVVIKKTGIQFVDLYLEHLLNKDVEKFNGDNKKYFDEHLRYFNYKESK